MGKKRREKMNLGTIREAYEGLKQSSELKREEFRQTVASQTKMKYMDRWMERSAEIRGEPCESMNDIVWTDPQIHIESLLCDPVYCLQLRRKEVQEEFLGQLTDEEVELFFHRDEEGNSYSDLVRPNIVAALKSLYSQRGTS